MRKWTEPELIVFSVKIDENIVDSGSAVNNGEKTIGEFWYTGQGNGNIIWGNFYYSIIGNKKMVQDTFKAGGDNQIQKHDVADAISSCSVG